MMDSEQHTYVQAESDDAQSMLWSPTRPGDHSSQAKGVHSGGSWKTLVDPILPELLQAHEEFAAALEADGDNVTSLSGSSGHDDQGVVVSNLKKALPILLQENTTFRERLYSQSDFEPSASPAAENLHDKILHDQFRPYKKRISRLPLDRVHHSRSHQLAHMPKSPPQSPPFRLPHFGSLATLAPEDAPLLPKFQNESGQRNIQLLHAMRRNEVLADPTFTAPPPSRPRLPETASANEIVFLLRTQAQRRRKQVHDERIGQVG